MPKEIWKNINGFEDYQVSDLGRIKSLKTNKILRAGNNGQGYSTVCLYKNKVKYKFYVHRIVAEHFLTNENNLSMVNHVDENPSNNAASNLEYCDNTYNLNYGNAQARKAKSRSKSVNCVELNKTFESITQAAQELKILASSISGCLSNRSKTAGGYQWLYN